MNRFVFIVPSFNVKDWYRLNLESILNQTITDWRIIYINDCSTDDTEILINNFVKEHNLSDRFTLINNSKNLGPAASRYFAYQQCENDEICCMLDGDDWLYDKNVLETVANFYKEGYNYTYGSYYSYINGKIDNWLQPKPVNDINYDRKNSKWFCQHLRTFRAYLIKDIPISYLQINQEWIKCGTDTAESLYILENPKTKSLKIEKPLYVYNRDNSIRYSLSYYRSENNEYKNTVLQYIQSCGTK